MAKLTQVEMERLYDLERSGQLYTKPGADTVWADILNITDNPTDHGRDTPLSPVEARAIHALYPNVVIVPSRDVAHREDRLLNILERIADLDEPEQSEMLGYAMGLLDGMGMRK